MRRRFVCGLREVHKSIKAGKMKCIIVAPNIEHHPKSKIRITPTDSKENADAGLQPGEGASAHTDTKQQSREGASAKKGLGGLMEKILDAARERKVPTIYALSRTKLGRAFIKKHSSYVFGCSIGNACMDRGIEREGGRDI